MSSVFPAVKRQRGAALILALVVFAVVALLAGSLSMDFLVSIRRAENQLYGQQASALLRGAEAVARQQLQRDYNDPQSRKKDHVSEGWLNRPVEQATDTGVIIGTLCDLQGRFNLNNLPGAAGAAPGSYTFDQEVFIRLLQTLELEPSLSQPEAEELANAVIDWIDADSNVRGLGGAEDGWYSDRDPPYRAGNQPLHSVAELRWVKGITDELFRALEPHVTVLPPGTAINVNTADVLVLRSINQQGNLAPLSEGEAINIIEDRDGEVGSDNPANMNRGFGSPGDFFDAHPAPALSGATVVVSSEHFLLDAKLLFVDRVFDQTAILYRDSNGHITTVARGRRGLGNCAGEEET